MNVLTEVRAAGIRAEIFPDASKMKKDPTVVGITAGTHTVFGFTPARRKEAGRQFIDMGIAEEQAVAMASAIAAGGGKPVFGVYSRCV